MKRNDIAITLWCASAVALLALVLNAAEHKSRADTLCFMCEKMSYAQAVLEGITLEKFDQVSKNSVRLRDMTQSNLWYTSRQPDYMKHTTNYQKSVEGLYLAAVDKNLNLCTERYAQMVRECVECHRLVRAEQSKSAFTAGKQ